MLTLKIGDSELKVKYGYEATLKTKLLSRLSKKEGARENSDSGMDSAEDMLLFLPDFLLVGLQKFHSDEFGFDYETGKGKEEQIEKMFGLIDDYLDSNETEDAITLYNALTEEMLRNGFLKSQFRKEMEKAENKQNVIEMKKETEVN